MGSAAADEKALLEEIAANLTMRLDELVERTFANMRREIPAWMREPPLDEETRGFTRSSILAELEALRSGVLPESCPPVDLYGARRGAEASTPLALLLDGYRAGHQAQWEAWSDEVEARDLDAPRRRALLARGSRFFFAYASRVSGFVTDAYEAERQRTTPGADQRRLHVVKQILAGDDTDAAALGHSFDNPQLGFIAWGPNARAGAEAFAKAIGPPRLLVPLTDEVIWGWLSPAETNDEPSRPGFGSFDPPSASRLAVGERHEGVQGFRHTHFQAEAAYRAGRGLARSLILYRDVALEDLTTRDRRAADAFIAAELRELDGDDIRSQRLRETALAYFRAGQNAKAAAAELGVHQQTVGERLGAIERATGRPVVERRGELEIALRVRCFLARSQAADDG